MAYTVQPNIVEDQQYDSNQHNTLGQPLATTTPANGARIATDPNNDKRSPLEQKQDHLQAQIATQSVRNTDDPLIKTGKNGFQYQLVDDSKAGQLRTGAMAVFEASLGGQMYGNVATAGSQAVNALIQRGKRQQMIDQLENDPAGWNQLDIAKWVETGNLKDLSANKGKWEAINGYQEQNSLTGELREIPISKQQQIQNDLAQQRIDADTAHTKFSEGIDSKRLQMEQQRLYQQQQQFETTQQQKLTAQQQKDQKAWEQKNTQAQAVAVQGNQMKAMGTDILTDTNFKDYSGSNYTSRAMRGLSSKFGESVSEGMKSKEDQYNHMGTIIGNAGLYLDADGKRIFAKEMENAGKTFQNIDHKTMTYDQIRTAVHNNEFIVNRFLQLAQASAEHQPHPNANQVDYGNDFGGNAKPPRVGVPAPVSAPQQGQSVTRNGRTFIFTGGNPNDQNNWKEQH